MPSTRFRAALVVGVLMLAALTGCGSDESNPKASSESAGPTVDKSGTAVDEPAFVSRLLEAVQAQKTARAELTLGTGVSAEAAFSYGAQTAADVSFELLGRATRIILVADKVYLQKAAGEKFVVLSRDDPSLEMLGGLSDVDPQKLLTGLSESIREVREIGPATVAGQSLTRYAVTVDAEELGSGMLGMIPGADLSEGLVLDLYLDEDDLLQRAEADLGQNDLTLVVTGWGEPVEIAAPPASQILSNQ